MFVFQLLLGVQLAFGFSLEVPIQTEIDRAFDLILHTQTGKAICRDILGADPEALELHLGVTRAKAEALAKDCTGGEPSEWIYPTSPADIRKLATKAPQARHYVLVHSDQSFPIESWTDPYSNTTTILSHSRSIPFSRLVQILAHETAVYFDSKSNPLHPAAEEIPHLRDLHLEGGGTLDGLLAVSDPMQAHTLTYLRALQVEFSILRELVGKMLITAPRDLNDKYQMFLVSDKCAHDCVKNLVVNMRQTYLPISLPLLAFAPHFRAVAVRELPKFGMFWDQSRWSRALQALNYAPVEFLKRQYSGDVVTDLTRVFYLEEPDRANFDTVSKFLTEDLWPLEEQTLSGSHFGSGTTLLEFMKRPLLSGYNILLSGGPRVRIRTGGIE